jgi:putative Holliday junction resolvase
MIFNNKKDFLDACPIGRLIGLDVGTTNIGIAVSDDKRIICVPSDTLKRQGNKKDFVVLNKIIVEKKIKGVVIGLPLYLNDEKSKITDFVMRFADNFSKTNALPIAYCDERLTSFEAECSIKEYNKNNIKKVVDKVAASYILESFLR